MKHFPDGQAASTFLSDSNDNSATIHTIAAVADERHVLDYVTFGYNGTPGAVKSFTMTIDGVTKFQVDLPAATQKANHITFKRGWYGAKNVAVVATLPASGTGGVVGFVNIGHR